MFNSFQVPNWYVDDLMPILSEAEFKVLMFTAKHFNATTFVRLQKGTGLPPTILMAAIQMFSDANMPLTELAQVSPEDVNWQFLLERNKRI